MDERESLGFAAAATAAFEFLEERGFRRVRAEPTIVRYESGCAFVVVYHGRSSYELSVELGLRSASAARARLDEQDGFFIGRPVAEDSVSIWDVSRFAGSPDVDAHTFLQASTTELIRKLLVRLADLTKLHADPILRCDTQFFDALERWRRADSQKLMKDMELRDARARAGEAWKRRDFHGVIAAFEPVEPGLSPAEGQKLAYARKHAGGGQR